MNKVALEELISLKAPLQQSLIILIEDAINFETLLPIEGDKVQKTFRIRGGIRLKLKAIAQANALSLSDALSFLVHGYYEKKFPMIEKLPTQLQSIIVQLEQIYAEIEEINSMLAYYDASNNNLDRAKDLVGKEAQALLRWLDLLKANPVV
jgi:hypothetical protein